MSTPTHSPPSETAKQKRPANSDDSSRLPGRANAIAFARLRQWICTKIGHSFRTRDMIIFGIKTNERNRDMTAEITCRCCREVFVHKDAPDAFRPDEVSTETDNTNNVAITIHSP